MSMAKDDRLQIRVGPAEKSLLERPAAATRVSVSAFVVQSVAARAATVLADRPLIDSGG
jgi:uncharacterized protein (DUF1778 family)